MQLRDIEGRTPLHVACEYGHFHIVKYLVIEQGCDITCQSNDSSTPFTTAVKNKHDCIALFLTEKQFGSPKDPSWNLLHSACEIGHLDTTKFLAKHINPHLRDSHGLAPLHIACENGHLNIVKFLICEVRCDPMCMTSEAWTPLHSACKQGRQDVVKFLIEQQQCNAKYKTTNGITPLHLVCRHSHLDLAVYLLHKCVGDLSSSERSSLMDEALAGGSPDIIFLLLSSGANFSIKYQFIDLSLIHI